MNKTFYFSNNNKPTEYNLGVHLLQRGYQQDQPGLINDHHLALDELSCQTLEYKHLLAQLTQQYCPYVMPKTFHLHEDNVESVLADVSQCGLPDQHNVWILKPALLNNGEGIRLFSGVESIRQYYATPYRYGGDHVLQQYVTEPHCLKGHKYTLRMFAVIAQGKGIFLYQDGYFNIARSPYQAACWDQLDIHLTNEHLILENPTPHWQIPTTRHPRFDLVYPGLREIILKVMQAFLKQSPKLLSEQPNTPAMGLFGFDFIIDAQLRPWLLEVNHGPCFPMQPEHALQQPLYQPFWQQLIEYIIEPMLGLASTVSIDQSAWDSLMSY